MHNTDELLRLLSYAKSLGWEKILVNAKMTEGYTFGFNSEVQLYGTDNKIKLENGKLMLYETISKEIE